MDKIGNLKVHRRGMWLSMGDFNDVRVPEERVNSVFDVSAAGRFNDFISRMGWIEYRMSGGRFTYISDNVDIKLSKLDRALVCDDFMSRWPTAKLEVLNRGLSDHCPILLTCVDLDFGPLPFKFFNSWIGSDELKFIVSSRIGSGLVVGPADKYLGVVLKDIKEDIK